MDFRNSGLDGAGFQGFVTVHRAADTVDTGVVLACADVAGLHRSTDWGETWTTVAGWAYNPNHLKVAGACWSSDSENIVLLFTGAEGSSVGGGVWVSTDAGESFSQAAGSPTFAGGNNSNAALPSTHPRSTGRVGIIDYTHSLLYVGSYNSGVYRAPFNPTTGVLGAFTSIGSMSGLFIRSLAVDEANDQLFVACHDEVTAADDGVFLITSASSSASSGSKIAGAPRNPEELLQIGGRIYAVCGGPTTRGVFSCTAASPSTWTERSGGLPVSSPRWQGLDGYMNSSFEHVLYVGCDSPTSGTPPGGGTAAGNAIYRCDDARLASPTWTSLTLLTDGNTPREPLGQASEWWLAADSEFMMANRPGFDCASVWAAWYLPTDYAAGTVPTYLFAAGRGGVWRLDAPAASGSGLNDQWHPAVDGLAVTINRAVAHDPTRTGVAYLSNVDWVNLVTQTDGDTVVQSKPSGSGSASYTVCVDPTSGYAVLGCGDRDNNTDGQVYTRNGPAATWQTTNMQADGSTCRVAGVAAATVGADLVIVAARMEAGTSGSDPALVTNSGGLWRKVGTGSWTQILSPSVNGVMDNQASKDAPFTWPDQGTATLQTLYWYEKANGVWRSTTSGASWTRIWSTLSNAERTGYVSADPTNVNRLYISQSGTLYRADDAGTVAANSLSPTNITPVTGSGRISAIYCDHRGWIWACGNRTSSQQAALWRSINQGSSWTDLADDVYRDTALFPFGLTVDQDGQVYLALNGNGVLLSSGDATVDAAAAITAAGTLGTDPRQVQDDVVASFVGASALEAAAKPTVVGVAGFTGTATDTATGQETVLGAAAYAAAAALVVTPTVEQGPTAEFAGTATLDAQEAGVTTTVSGVARERGDPCSTLVELEDVPPYGSASDIAAAADAAGSGLFTVDTPLVVINPTATFAGAGVAAGDPGQVVNVSASFAGTATIEAAFGSDVSGVAGFAGTGAAAADGLQIQDDVSAAYTGAGTVTIGTVLVEVPADSTPSGAGTLTVQVPTQDINPIATSSGTGALAADPTVVVLPTAAFSGTGEQAMAGNSDISASATFTGTGFADGQITLIINTAATFDGTAGMTIAVGADMPATATFGGVGGGELDASVEARDQSHISAHLDPRRRTLIGRLS